ncbi:MAG: glycosyltransferase family A protein, partial [Candidatus Thermoplasmatota archaeon]
MAENISIIINVYNEEDDIEYCLDSLKNQTLSDFELVIVDDGSTDDTMNIVEEYEEEFDMKKLLLSHQGLREARKRGVEEASGEVVVIVDADEVLEPDFLENLVEPFEDEKVGAVGGRLRSEGKGWVTKDYGSLNEAFYELRTDGEEV